MEKILGKQIKILEGNISRLKALPVKDYIAQSPSGLLADLKAGGIENLDTFMDQELDGLTAMLSIELNKVAIEKIQARLASYNTAKELVFSPTLDAVMAEYDIDTKVRVAAFVSQLGHESSNLSLLKENLNYSASGLMRTWPTRFTLALATEVERNPEAIANIVYGGRMGNDQPGDGWRYRGRGYLQITGKNNYRSLGEALGLDLINSPELLEDPVNAARSSGHFWSTRGLNGLIDSGDFIGVTQAINGGQHGAEDRLNRYNAALNALNAVK